MTAAHLHAEKLAQAQAALNAGDLWLIAARESGERPEPGLTLVAGLEVTWEAYFLVTREAAVAILGRFDADAVPPGWTVLPYDQDVTDTLRAEVARLAPRRVLVNFAPHDPLADGLTHGMFLRLGELLPGVALSSAAAFLGRLRSVKTPAELAAIRDAVEVAEAHLAALFRNVRPGWTESQVADFLQARCREAGGEPSWGWQACPNVHIGPQSRPSHAPPGDLALAPGMLLHIDYGVRLPSGYCSDIQRTACLPRPGEGVPAAVEAAFHACWQAIEAGAQALRPGTPGFEVDAAARSRLVAQGHPEYLHALGHGLGRATHDGGTLLGPRWPRYGTSVEGLVQLDEVYTLELGTFVEGHGFVGLEEDVVVRPAGLDWLSRRQNELFVLKA